MSWRARNGFSPSWTKKASSAWRSRPSRFTLEASAVTCLPGARAQVEVGEEVRDLLLRRLGGVGAVHHVLVHGGGEVAADGALVGLLRVGGAHDVAVLEDRALAFQRRDHHRTGDHEVHQRLEERTLTVHRVETLGLGAGQVQHAGGDDLEALLLEAGIDLADQVLGDAVGFDDGQGTFDGHERVLRTQGGWMPETGGRLSPPWSPLGPGTSGDFQTANFTGWRPVEAMKSGAYGGIWSRKTGFRR